MKLTSTRLLFLLTFLSCSVFAQNYETEQVATELFHDTIERTGKLDFKRTVSLSFKNSGYLSQLNVYEGEQFKKGQLLAALDITELKENKNANYAQLLQAKREVKRITMLLERDMASQRDLDVAITQEQTSRSAYQISYYNLEKSTIYAPFDGIVLSRNSDLGELQNPGQEVLRVAKFAHNWVVKVALTGQEVAQVKLQQKVQVSLNQIGTIEGVVNKIPAIANTNNLFTIEVLLPSLNLSSGIIAGQLAAVKIAFASKDLVYRLPIKALVSVDEHGKAVVVVKSQNTGELEQKNFDIYQLDNQYVYLKANASDQSINIVSKGWQHLSLGER